MPECRLLPLASGGIILRSPEVPSLLRFDKATVTSMTSLCGSVSVVVSVSIFTPSVLYGDLLFVYDGFFTVVSRLSGRHPSCGSVTSWSAALASRFPTSRLHPYLLVFSRVYLQLARH